MKIAGMLRVKNESRWISRVLASIKPLCDVTYVFDDHSTDNTVELCNRAGAWTTVSKFDGINETRDKNHLLDCIMKLSNPDWVLHIDGDEVLAPGAVEAIRAAITANFAPAYSLPILYLWNDEHTVRMDGIYGNFVRQSLFNMRKTNGIFNPTAHGKGTTANLHCTNVPADLVNSALMIPEAYILHYGYIDRDMRLNKWDFYNTVDPDNLLEDRYRHVVAGDIPEGPASIKTKWAGPLKLTPLAQVVNVKREVVNA